MSRRLSASDGGKHVPIAAKTTCNPATVEGAEQREVNGVVVLVIN